MTILLAALAGYVIGSLPTAVWLGRLWGVELLRDGSRNPGANNARRLGGDTLAVLVLIIEIAKGLTAVVVGMVIGGETAAIGGEAATTGGEAAALAAGLGAVTGNVYNVWHRFKGGKGLGISGGVILGLWPAAFPFVVLTLVVGLCLDEVDGDRDPRDPGGTPRRRLRLGEHRARQPLGSRRPCPARGDGGRHRADHRPEALAGCPTTVSGHPSVPDLQQDRHRAGVDQLNIHRRPEHTGLDVDARAAQHLHEAINHSLCLFWWSRPDE